MLTVRWVKGANGVGTRVSERTGVARTFSFVYTLHVYVRV